jgi:hypothetical protein
VFTYYAMGMGRNRPVASISVLYSVLTVVSTIVLVSALGSIAAGLGLLLASMARVIVSMILTKRLFFAGLGWPELLISTAVPVLVGCGIALLCRHLLILRTGGWPELVFQYGALSAVVVLACLLAAGMTSSGRNIISQLAKSLRKQRA